MVQIYDVISLSLRMFTCLVNRDAWEKQRGVDPKQAKWLYVQVLQKV